MTGRHGRALSFAALLAVVNACTGAARLGPAVQERPWPEYLGGGTRAAAAPDALAEDPQPVWRTQIGRGTVGAPAVGDDVIAVALVDRQVVLLERTTGEVIWRRRAGQHLGAGPLLADDRLLVATLNDGGRVTALRLTDGHHLWSRGTGDVAAPLAHDGRTVYAGTLRGEVHAVRIADGARLWTATLSGAVRAAPVLVPGGIVVATTADSLYWLDRADGRIAARRATRGAVVAAPAFADTLLWFGTMAGRLEAADPATLATRWHRDLDGPVVGHVAVRRARAYALTAAGVLWVVPVERPDEARALPAGLVARAGPSPTASGTLVGSVTGELVLLDADGRRRWSTRLASAIVEPVTVLGRVLIAVTQRGEVVAFR